MKRRTTITLTILGILALTGIFYAANPQPFATIRAPVSDREIAPAQPADSPTPTPTVFASPTPFATVNIPIGVAASRTDLIVSEWCTQNIDTIDCLGNVSLLAMIPGLPGCLEKYLAIAPSQSALATPPWSPRDIFVTQGAEVWKISGPPFIPTLFATIPGCGADHTGITFDHVGTSGFGYNMIVTCNNGGVWEVNATGTPTPIANTGTQLEGPVVAPLSFGLLGGQIWVADENDAAVHAIKSDGTITFGVVGWPAPEGLQVIPSVPCAFCSGGAFFQAIENFNAVFQYPPTDFSGLGGNLLQRAGVLGRLGPVPLRVPAGAGAPAAVAWASLPSRPTRPGTPRRQLRDQHQLAVVLR